MDIVTLIIVTAVISFGSALTVLLIYRLRFTEQGILFWVFGSFSISCSLILISLRGTLPNFFTIIVANMFITYGFAFIWNGMRLFFARSSMFKTTMICPLLIVPFMYWFSEIQPVLWVRIVVASLAIASFSGATALELFKDLKLRDKLAQRFLGTVFAINTAVFVIRIFLTIIQQTSGPFLKSGSVTIILFLWTSVFFIGITSGLILIISERLKVSQKKAEDALKKSNENLEYLVDKKTVELKKSKEKYQAIFDHANEGILVANKGKIALVNKTLRKMFGYKKGYLESKPFIDFVHPDDRELVFKRYKKRIAGEDLIASYEFRITTASGEKRWVEINSSVINWEGENSTLNFLTDITIRKLALQTLEESESRLKAIMDNTSALIYIKDLEGKFLLANKELGKLLKCSQKYIIGKTDYDFMPEELADQYRDNDNKVIQSRKPQIFEEIAKVEEVVTTAVSIKVPLFDTKDNIIGVCGISTDISERVKIEEDLQKSNDRLFIILNSIDAHIYVVDMNTYEILFMNKKMIDSFGDDFTGQLCCKVFRGEKSPCPFCKIGSLME